MKIDFEKLREALLHFIQSPQWKPWQEGWKIEVDAISVVLTIDNIDGSRIRRFDFSRFVEVDVILLASCLGLKIEDFEIPPPDYKKEVIEYLETIPEGGVLVEGLPYKKYSNSAGTHAALNSFTHYTLIKNDLLDKKLYDCMGSYYFLRLDLRAEQPK